MTTSKQFPAGAGPGTNTGHGHVWIRPDGVRARCGGPGMCSECAKDAAQYQPVAIPLAPILANGWLTIDTAPKDGTLIDVWFADGDPGDVEFYCSPGLRRSPDWRWFDNARQFRPVVGLTAMATVLPVTVQPTHWRPRPEGPRA